jgi:hypothetical protein
MPRPALGPEHDADVKWQTDCQNEMPEGMSKCKSIMSDSMADTMSERLPDELQKHCQNICQTKRQNAEFKWRRNVKRNAR